MRAYVAQISHESNSFSPIPTSLRSFEETALFRPSRLEGEELARRLGRWEASAVGYGDLLRRARERGHSVVAGLAAWAQPSAPASAATWEELRDEVLAEIAAARPLDMVLLFLHGAQMAQGYDDCEGDLLERCRRLVGPRVPIGVLLDLHCNLSPAMLRSATAILACLEYPHTDYPERARLLFDLVERAARGGAQPVMGHVRVPTIGFMPTTREPMKGMVEKARALQGSDGIAAVSVVHGFSRADTEHTSAGVLVVTDGPEAGARGRALAADLAGELFALREQTILRSPGIDEVLDEALRASSGPAPPGPVVIADVSDNPGGGAAGDSTFLLRRMLERGIEDAALSPLWDPVAVRLAADAGEGTVLRLRIGGKMGPQSGPPLDVEATVVRVVERAHQLGFGAQPIHLGSLAALRVGGIDVVLNTLRQQTHSLHCFTEAGIDPRAKRILVVKSSQHFWQHFASIASRILYCDAPGTLSSDLRSLPYRKLRRPVWPLDEVATDEVLRPASA
jgi:microcystin degradation protein MlrC